MTEKLDLEAIRREIDEADSNLINAFERRLQAVLQLPNTKSKITCLCATGQES